MGRLERELCEAPRGKYLLLACPLFAQQERDSAHIWVCPLFSKEGLTKVMTENFFAKPAKHNLSPETKWFPFPTPCLPPAFQIIVGRRTLQPESRLDASALCPPTALRQTCSVFLRIALPSMALTCSVPPQLTVSSFFYLPQCTGLTGFFTDGCHHSTGHVAREPSLSPWQRTTRMPVAGPEPVDWGPSYTTPF